MHPVKVGQSMYPYSLLSFYSPPEDLSSWPSKGHQVMIDLIVKMLI